MGRCHLYRSLYYSGTESGGLNHEQDVRGSFALYSSDVEGYDAQPAELTKEVAAVGHLATTKAILLIGDDLSYSSNQVPSIRPCKLLYWIVKAILVVDLDLSLAGLLPRLLPLADATWDGLQPMMLLP